VLVTVSVLTTKLALDKPPGTVTWLGTMAFGLLLDRLTGVPPLGAFPVR
jgi:hypothetical protein